MFSTIFPPAIGGPATQSFNLCKALAKNGETPIVVTYGDNFSVKNEHGFKVYTFRLRYTNTPLDKALRWFVFFPFILYIILKEKIQIVHCHSASALSFVTGGVAKILGIPSVIKFAGDWVWETLSTYKLQAKDFNEMYKISLLSRFMTVVERIGINFFDKIWVVSDFRRENIKTLLGSDKKTILINNSLLLENGGAKKSGPHDPIVMVTASRFIPHKRVPFIVELFAEANVPNSILILIGGGSDAQIKEVEDVISKHNIKDRVILKGILSSSEVYQEFQKASFYISASLEEGLPNVFIEAMHYGLPIITSDAGGSGEMVSQDKNGYVIDPYDKDKFVEKIRILSSDHILRSKMSEESFERSKNYNLEYKIREFIDLYKSLIAK